MAAFPHPFSVQTAQRSEDQGIIATTRLAGKSRENPYIQGYGVGKGVLEDTFSSSWPVLAFPVKGPTPEALI